jgi:RNA repair pathway DNA polymerase beta family
MTSEPIDDSLPLPHGTDVITRVARSVDGEAIAAATVGRVVGTHGEELDLHILGVGVVRYRRSDVAPFRSGQLRYALARDSAWSALHRNVVLEAIVGSRAWGLSDHTSDTDHRGLFVLPFSWTTRLGDVPADLVSADGSSTYWEAAKVVNNALRADPNTLELLFVPTVYATDPLGELFLAEREAFLSSRIHASFGQYALSQLKKLKRSLRLAEHREVVMDWLRVDPTLSLDAAAARLAERAHIIAPSTDAATLQAKEYLKQLYASLFDQGVLGEKSFAALVRRAREDLDPSELPRRLRPKNAYNLLRLLVTATGWLRTGSPEFEMKGAMRNDLLAIKRGEVDLESVLQRAEGLSRELDEARRATKLPERPDLRRAQALLTRVREDAARRWLNDADDAFARRAAPVPLPEWKA